MHATRYTLGSVVLGAAVTAAVLTPASAQAATLEATLVKTTNTSEWARPSPDPSGVTWRPVTGQLIISDSEVDEMPLYAGTNLFVSNLAGQQSSPPGGTTLAFSDEPTGVGLAQSSDTLFVSDDDQDRIFTVQPGADGVFGTGDDGAVGSFGTTNGDDDPEDVAVDLDATNNGTVLVIDGGDRDVYEYTRSGNIVRSFDVYQYGARDPEGLEYHAGRNTVLVLDGRTKKIYELSRTGALLNTIGITAANSIKAADLALAPASDGSGRTNLYIVDRGIDNNVDPAENDGRLYEMSVDFPPLPGPGDPVGGSLDVSIKAGKDDAEERAAGTALSGRLDIVTFRSEAQTVGLRFPGVTIPRGATITNAYVQFQADAASTAAASLTIAGQASDNAPTFSTAIGNISSRPRTSAAVGWTPAGWPTVGARGADQRTSDVAPVLQEIVSRTGWASGNAVVLIITGSGTRAAESYNTGGTAAAPALHVEWTN